MSRRVAILQSSYIPWKGTFDLIHDVDEFVFLDDVQYTRQNWRNRNRIKTNRGPRWLTIPVGTHLDRRICDVTLPQSWSARHWRELERWYAPSPFFEMYRPLLEPLYRENAFRLLSDWNQHAIRTIAREALGIETRFRDLHEFECRGRRQERVLDLLCQLDATVYVSGPAGKAYLDEARFAEAGIELVWKSYDAYPEYPQFHPPFAHEVTVLDLLFHTGPRAPWYIWGWRHD